MYNRQTNKIMKLIIDTTDSHYIYLTLSKADKVMAKKKIEAFRKQGEKLLIGIDKFLKAKNVELKELTEVGVVNGAGSFSSLRIGIATANALAYALGIKVSDMDGQYREKEGIRIVEPKYSAEANIGPTKKPVDNK